MNAFATAAAAIFADRNIGEDALWLSDPVGIATPVRVIVTAPDELSDFGGGSIVSETMRLSVSVAGAPSLKDGDLIQIGDDIFMIRGAPTRDETRVFWSAQARKT